MLCDLGDFRKDPEMTFSYNYFVDDSPTRFVGGVVEPAPEVKTKSKSKTKNTQKEKSGILPVLLGITIALVLAVIVLLIIFLPGLFGATGGSIETPEFIGMKWEDVNNSEEYKENFKFEEPKWDYNPDYAYGYVYEQSIDPGDKVKPVANITLYVSMGQKTTKVNDVRGMSEVRAIGELEANNFKVKIKEMASDTYDAGLVIRSEPQQGTPLSEGSTVTIFVSTGKPTEYVSVPNVVGEPLEQAKEKLTDNKLLVVVEYVDISWDEKYQPNGYVLKQSPESSSAKIVEGSTVTVYVSMGAYTADLDIPLPSNYNGETKAYLSIWKDGQEIDVSGKLDLTQLKTHTFEGVDSKNKTATYVIKIKTENSSWSEYMTIRVNYRASSKAELITVIS